MGNFLRNKKWSPGEWNIFHNNIELLRIKEGITMGELNTRANYKNLMRKDQNHIDMGTISHICEEFNVTEAWLSTDHIARLMDENFHFQFADMESVLDDLIE